MLLKKTLLAAIMVTSLGVSAKEVIVNGTFSDPSSALQSGWVTGALSYNYLFSSNSFFLGDAGSIWQEFTGLSGPLTLTFSYYATGSTNTTETIYWNDTVIGTINGSPGLQTYTYTFTGSPAGKLLFNSASVYGITALSNVSLQDSAPVPEPATYAMLLAGLAATGAMARRRRS